MFLDDNCRSFKLENRQIFNLTMQFLKIRIKLHKIFIYFFKLEGVEL